MNDPNPLERYSRHMRFPGMGKAGQDKLLKSRVTLCGFGALGTVVATVPGRAGVRRTQRPTMSPGTTHWSNCSAVTWPEAMAASRRLLPSLWAFLAM